LACPYDPDRSVRQQRKFANAVRKILMSGIFPDSHFQHFQRIPRSEGKSSSQLDFFRQLGQTIVNHDSDDADDNSFCVLLCTLYSELCTVFIASMAAAQTAAAAIISPVPAVFAPQWLRSSCFPPRQNATSAALPVLPARHRGCNFANAATNVHSSLWLNQPARYFYRVGCPDNSMIPARCRTAKYPVAASPGRAVL
jgi:hypothetical protein